MKFLSGSRWTFLTLNSKLLLNRIAIPFEFEQWDTPKTTYIPIPQKHIALSFYQNAYLEGNKWSVLDA